MAEEGGKSPDVKGGGKILLIVGLVVGLGVGGGGAYLYFMDGQNNAPDAEFEAEVAAEPEEPDDPQYVEIKRLTGPLISETGGVLGYVFLDVSLEVNGTDDQEYLSGRRAILQDAFLKEMSANPMSRPGQPGVIDYEGLQERFRRVGNGALNNQMIRRVLITRAQRQ